MDSQEDPKQFDAPRSKQPQVDLSKYLAISDHGQMKTLLAAESQVAEAAGIARTAVDMLVNERLASQIKGR